MELLLDFRYLGDTLTALLNLDEGAQQIIPSETALIPNPSNRVTGPQLVRANSARDWKV